MVAQRYDLRLAGGRARNPASAGLRAPPARVRTLPQHWQAVVM